MFKILSIVNESALFMAVPKSYFVYHCMGGRQSSAKSAEDGILVWKLKLCWPRWAGKREGDERTLDLYFSPGFRFGEGGFWFRLFVMDVFHI